ncbi:ABC transporter ATP-binding protein [Paenibacillus radicis (ex Gao et al. 2016)]|uniref:Multidrug resistance ABC transporter ATP-binding/permease protein YheH n=1 Tax=Paenibacillus radicis (ex Gao et al. 2016) TaxID=1737354 RepID=A0A917M2U3_9BACL|nr:ABC transporter ATP-binding protein [Paenibacillus radicis (ex Gao et al. 2016)]GGG73705.1 putative multidrug resistance ABC transporter ATP-binding/permease protein YheH [Paenibacillus radicis (ex Gao et al. 2016)]
MGHTGKRLFQYAMLYKKPIIWALLLLVLAVSSELAGPFIAKRMIDQNILGIEKKWHEVAAQERYAVEYKGKWYKREDHYEPGEAKGAEVRVLQSGRKFYWLEGALPNSGERRTVQDGVMTVTSKESGEQASVPVTLISAKELYQFYKPEIPALMVLAGVYFGLLLLGAVFTYGQRLLLQTSANKIVRQMRNDVFAHTQRLPVGYFDTLAAGQVVSRVTNDTEAIRELYVAVLANFFSAIVYMTAIYGALFLLDARLALFALPLVPILIIWIKLYRKVAARYNRIIRAKLSEINGMINESIQGMPIIQAFRRQKETMKEFDELNEHYFTYQNKLLSLNSITSHNLVNVIRNLMFLVVIIMFWGDWLGAAVGVGVLYAFVDLMNRMFQPIVGVVNQLSNLETARVSAERVFTLMDQEGVEVVPGTMERYRGEVQFEDVTFAYKKEEYVLKNISFTARQGQTVALVGHTGSGKSSILNLLFRFYDTNKGRITIDGQDVLSIPKQHLRHHMGIVLQDPFLFTGTIASNVSLDNPAISRETIEQALRDVGAYEMFASLPGGIDAPVIEKGSTLSAGQRQLISFARALAYDPAILILDEATASIDTETEAIIQQALDVLKKGRTTFVIAHRLSTIRQADQILVLDRGRIVERGNHEQLMEHRGKYFAMYQLQQGAAVTAS